MNLYGSQLVEFRQMEAAITSLLQTSVDWVTRAFEVPFARAHVFGVQIGGIHFYIASLLEYVWIPFYDGKEGGRKIITLFNIKC